MAYLPRYLRCFCWLDPKVETVFGFDLETPAYMKGFQYSDKELRRGLGQITGFHAIEPLVEQVINKEFTIDLHGS